MSDYSISSSPIDKSFRRHWLQRICASDFGADWPVISAKPAVLVVGCGASGLMKVAEETKEALGEQGIRLEAMKTDEAVGVFNELAERGENVAAALHLTC